MLALRGREVNATDTGRLKLLIVLVIVLLAVSCSNEARGPDYWPTEGWRTSSPEEQGMSPAILQRTDSYVEEDFSQVRAVLVVRHGYIVFEKYYQGYDKSDYHHIHSATKSFTSALTGIALREGHIEGLDEKLPEFFADSLGSGVDQRKKNVTLEDLLTMRAGFEWDPQADIARLLFGPRIEDLVGFFLGRPMAHKPGEEFVYDDGSSHLLSAILTRSTGQSALTYAHEKLFGPLGIPSDPDATVVGRSGYERRFKQAGFAWLSDGHGNSLGYMGLKLRPRDMAKLGYLYLNGGRWDGEQIVPAWYVEESTRKQSEGGFYLDAGYGYQWWTTRIQGHHAFFAAGFGGQFIYVVPDLDVVAVIVSDDETSEDGEPVQRFIRPANLLVDYTVVPAVEDG